MRLQVLILFNIIVLLITTVKTQASENKLRCEETNACTCFDYNELEIQCPKFEPHVIVRIQPNNYVHFECENMTGKEYELVPNYQLDIAAFLQITKCRLLPGKSIMESYLKNFKINRIRNFQFVSSGANKEVEFETNHFRGLDNIDRFDLRGMEDEITRLPEDLFIDMKNLSWVRIRVAKIHLPRNLFAPLENLEFLELGHNKLESLPEGFLRNQRKLVQLNLWGNSLKNLKKESFVGLDLVRELDLSANGMESLESDVLYHFTNLTDINLNANNFKALPEDLFQNNRKLKIVRLLENRVPMTTLPRGLFANLTDLSEVSLKADLQTLPEDIFEGSYKIVQMKLNNNLLNNLPAKLLWDQKSLEKLELQENRIESLDDSFFRGTVALRELYLWGNHLKIITE
jgi:protein toll